MRTSIVNGTDNRDGKLNTLTHAFSILLLGQLLVGTLMLSQQLVEGTEPTFFKYDKQGAKLVITASHKGATFMAGLTTSKRVIRTQTMMNLEFMMGVVINGKK